jgi:hypothetical protein
VKKFFAGQVDLTEDLWRLLVLAQWRQQVHQRRGYEEKS